MAHAEKSDRNVTRLARVALVGAAMLLAPLGGVSAAPPVDLDAYVSRTLATFAVPGASVAIVEPGPSAARGYGIRKMGGTAPVDAHTLFPIGSNTKAFTVAGLALLVDRGQLSWDDSVGDAVPGFRLYDAYATHELPAIN